MIKKTSDLKCVGCDCEVTGSTELGEFFVIPLCDSCDAKLIKFLGFLKPDDPLFLVNDALIEEFRAGVENGTLG